MSLPNCPGPDLLLLVEHDLTDEDAFSEAAGVRDHLEGCDDCKLGLSRLEKGLAPPELPFDPADALGSIRERLPQVGAAGDAASHPDVHLLCTYCKDRLPNPQATYCAQCLAPHHAECYAEHGSCASCGGTLVVRSGEGPKPRRSVGPWLAVLLALTGGGVAALTFDEDSTTVAEFPLPRPVAARAPNPVERTASKPPVSSAEDYTTLRYSVADVLANRGTPISSDSRASVPEWVREFERRLDSRRITLNFPQTSLAEAVAFLQDVTGLNVILSQAVDPTIEVSLRLKDIRLRDAVDLILASGELERRFQNEALLIVPKDQRTQALEPAEWPLAAEDDPQATPLEALAAQARAAVSDALGPAAWSAPGRLVLRREGFEVTQTEAGHTALAAFLDPLRPTPVPASLQGAWFAPDWRGFEAPGLARARGFARTVERSHVTLNFEQTTIREAAAFLAEISGVPCRVSPSVVTLSTVEPLSVSLRLKDISLKNVLNLLVSSNSKLVWDVDRDGVLIRTVSSPSLEARLRTAARDTLTREESEAERRVRVALARQVVTWSFDKAPLSDVVRFLQDVTPLNYVLSRRVDAKRTVSDEAQNTPLGVALRRLLGKLQLGIGVEDGVVHVVDAARLARREALDRAVKTQAGMPFGERLHAATLGAFAARLEEAVEGYVVLNERARVHPGRLLVPAGQTVAQALELVRAQLGARVTWGRLPALGKVFVVIDVPADGAGVPGALALLERRLDWADAPSVATGELAEAKAALLAELQALAATPDAEVAARLAQVEQARGALHERCAWLELLEGAAKDAEPDPLNAVFGALAACRRELRAHHEATKALSPERLEALQDQLIAASARDAGWHDRAPLRDSLQTQIAEFNQKRRGAALTAAQLGARIGKLTERLRGARALPSRRRLLRERLARLRSGEGWEAVFPERFATWAAAREREIPERVDAGLKVLAHNGLSIEAGAGGATHLLGSLVEGLRAGDVIVGVGGEQVATPLGAVEALGAASGESVLLELADGRTLTLPLPPQAAEAR